MKQRGVVDVIGVISAVGFGILLAFVGALTQSVLVPAIIAALAFLTVLLKDGLVEIRF